MNRDDVIMSDRRRRLSFACESLPGERIRRVFTRRDLDRHDAVERWIARLQHDSQAAAADDRQHLVATEFTENALFG